MLRDEQNFIFQISTLGNVKHEGNLTFEKDKQIAWESWVYHNIRCADTHEAGLDYSKIELIEKDYGFSIFRYNSELNSFTAGGSKKFVISKHSIIALILIIQLEEKNKSLKFDTTYSINQKTFSVADYLGNKNNLLKFLFPKEPIIRIGEKGTINVKS